MSDDDGGGAAGAGLEEEDMPVFCPPDQFSAIAKRILSSILGKLERLSLLKRIKRVLSKRPETRNVQDIDLLVKTTRHLPIFACMSIMEHRDLCHALRFHRAKVPSFAAAPTPNIH
ncbi:hypothetical protein CYMTET_15728 [Cymbomonas tetramitiformis]|uniref:Uncharacterized protein n=1 Tax=Cymbomonas tetramitiformis TaxID=36881 RepID=A0AAE0L8P3_9CHLO|nr:hypothetical protein CYMTET_15728 [Cymbomonas tetramitiformis]